MKNRHVEMGLVVSIIILLIISSIGPMTTGNDTMTHNKESSPDQDDFIFYAGSDSPYTTESIIRDKYLHYMQYFDDSLISKNRMNLEETFSASSHYKVEQQLPQTISYGPMDSAWPMKCHDNKHTGRSPYSTAGNPDGVEIWRFKCDSVEGSPVIGDDGILYFGDFDDYLYALYPNGTLKWKYKTDMWIWSAPAIADDGTIYVGSWDCGLYAIYPNGTLKWRFSAGAVLSSSPAIGNDGTIYFGNADRRIFAVNPNGTEKWHYDTGADIWGDPAIGEDGTIYIGSWDNNFYALYPNGTLRWQFPTGNHIKGPPSIADDGTIYIGSWDDYLYALYPNGTMKWRHQVGKGTESNPSIGLDGTIYVGGDYLYAIYPNGTRKWTFDFGSHAHSFKSSPAIDSNGIIYIGTNFNALNGGELVSVNPDGTLRWCKKIANFLVDSSPCIGEDGTVYISSSSDDQGYTYGYLHAFGDGEPNNPPDDLSISG